MILTTWRLRLLTFIAVVVVFVLFKLSFWDSTPLLAPACPSGINCS
jgi:hypothetical protein